MLRARLLLVPILSAVLALISFGTAAGEASNDATLVVYRAGEFARTERLRVDVRLGSERLGKLQREQSIASAHPAGTYVVSTGIPGAETLEVDLKPGQVHYVRIDLRERTHHLQVGLVEVEEQVAHVERPELANAI